MSPALDKPAPTSSIQPDHLLKLRLCVARFGEMDLAGWWNTKGVLGSMGVSVYRRGFPKTHLFTQARVACAVAAERCRAVFSPPGCITLWNLPPAVEDLLGFSWQQWCREIDSWEPFFAELAAMTEDGLLPLLEKLDLIDAATMEAAKGLRRGAEGKGVALPGSGTATPESIMLLAAAFSRGEKGKLAVPYLKLDD
jgi:hypothetical protein